MTRSQSAAIAANLAAALLLNPESDQRRRIAEAVSGCRSQRRCIPRQGRFVRTLREPEDALERSGDGAPSRNPTPRSVSAVHGGGDTTHVCGGHRIGLHQLGEPITGDGESDQVGVGRHSGRTLLSFDRASLSHHLIG